MTFHTLCDQLDGKWVEKNTDYALETVAIDSRQVNLHSTTVFFAIEGTQHNGHDYIEEVYAKGVRCFVVAQKKTTAHWKDANVYAVKNTTKALQYFAKIKRQKVTIPVYGITGSNGKTIVKEWLSDLLKSDFSIIKSPLSHNSQVGVPLSVWPMQQTHSLGIFEAGISTVGEMDNLQSVIAPTVGILTNIGHAHDAGFASRHEKLLEKLKLFKGVQCLIFRDNEDWVSDVIFDFSFTTFSWGYHHRCTLRITDKKMQSDGVVLGLEYKNRAFTLKFHYSDSASIENLLHCVCAMLYLEYGPEVIQKRITALRPVRMRLELKKGIQNSYLVDDSYSHEFYGLTKALNYVERLQIRKRKVLILSDFDESHGYKPEVYQELTDLIEEQKDVATVIGIGSAIRYLEKELHHFQHYTTTEDFIRHFKLDLLQDTIVLIKGARSFRFELLVERLEAKSHGTVLEINLNAISNNLNYYRSRVKPDTKLMVMVKALAYGSGSEEISGLLQREKIDYLGVAYTDEGVQLRQMGIDLPIMVMNPVESTFSSLLQHNLEPEVYSISQLKALLGFLGDRPVSVHIKLDTGMRRLGYEMEAIPELTTIIKENKQIFVRSIFSHLSGADESEHDSFSANQVHLFEKGYAKIASALGYKPIKHIVNSAGILAFPEYHFDMVRLGVGLYGVEPRGVKAHQLEPISQLKTTISQIKHISKGETVGYGRKGKLNKEATIATISIGYADGFNRRLGNGKGCVLINGHIVPVVGNVCMDMTMIDITGVEASEGDEVVVFGQGLSIQEMAERLETIPYEILTSINDRVKRIYFYD